MYVTEPASEHGSEAGLSLFGILFSELSLRHIRRWV
ncbi:hypothetical protein HD557_001160 [Nocardioides luteus]|nr:hypothetical protein [Nocardioides luteus]